MGIGFLSLQEETSAMQVGVDYIETFEPVAKIDSIKLVLAIAASKRWEVHHMDVKSDFIHGDLHEDIYI